MEAERFMNSDCPMKCSCVKILQLPPIIGMPNGAPGRSKQQGSGGEQILGDIVFTGKQKWPLGRPEFGLPGLKL